MEGFRKLDSDSDLTMTDLEKYLHGSFKSEGYRTRDPIPSINGIMRQENLLDVKLLLTSMVRNSYLALNSKTLTKYSMAQNITYFTVCYSRLSDRVIIDYLKTCKLPSYYISTHPNHYKLKDFEGLIISLKMEEHETDTHEAKNEIKLVKSKSKKRKSKSVAEELGYTRDSEVRGTEDADNDKI